MAAPSPDPPPATGAPAGVLTRPGLRRDIFGAAAILMGAFLLSRATGLLRTIAVSYRFGTGAELDAYLAANRLSDLLFQVVAGGAVASAFIPVLSAYLARGEREQAWRMVSALFTLAVAGLAPICLLLGIFAPQVMGLITQMEGEQLELAGRLARIMLASPVIFALGTFATSVLNVQERFLLAALAPSLYNLGIIVGALILTEPLGVYGLAIGSALGALLYLLVQIPGLVGCGLRYTPRLGFDDPGVRRVGLLMAPRTLGLAVTQLNFVVIVYLASPLPGAIAALDYAWTLMMLPLGLFAMAISTAVFPALADLHARDELAAMTRTLVGTLRVILYLTIPASVGLAVLAEPIVRLLLERGQFTPESTALTVGALRFYALGLLGQATIEIVTRAFYALHDTLTPVAIAALAMALNLGLALALREPLGHRGLALALALASVVEAALLLLLARRRLGGAHDGELVASALRSGLGAAALGLALLLVLPLLGGMVGGDGLVGRALALLGAVWLGAAVYLGATLALRSEEPRRVLSMARRRERSM